MWYLIAAQAKNAPSAATVGSNITQQNPTLQLVTTQFVMNAKHSRRRSDQVFNMSSTSFHTSSLVRNMKSTADAGIRRSTFRARVRRNAQFATMSSWARRFFKHFNFKFWRTIQYTEEWWIPVSRDLTCGSVTLWCTFLIKFEFIDRNNDVITHQCAHCEVVRSIDTLSYCHRFSIVFTTYSGQKPSNLSQEIF